MKKIRLGGLVFVLVISLVWAGLACAQELAFPGAMGFGKYVSGGRGGETVHVTNLNASGPGSLADAVSKPHRIVVIDVQGVIHLKPNERIIVADSVSVLGQTAPGKGITIYGSTFQVKGNNVILRYLRMRGSMNMGRGKCTFVCDHVDGLMVDHCSISWGRWDNAHIKQSRNVTWQNCIIAEGIAPQRFGAITDETDRWTVARCLWADNKSRNPKMKCGIQYVNNVVYNCNNGAVGGHSERNHYQDVVNNVFISGPTSDHPDSYFNLWTASDHLYQQGNVQDTLVDGKFKPQPVTRFSKATLVDKPNFEPFPAKDLLTVEQTVKEIIRTAGASKKRDRHDKRVIAQLKSMGKKGQKIDDETQVGGI